MSNNVSNYEIIKGIVDEASFELDNRERYYLIPLVALHDKIKGSFKHLDARAFYTEYKISANFIAVLLKLNIVKRIGKKMAYKHKWIGGKPDGKMIKKVVDEMREIERESFARSKEKAKQKKIEEAAKSLEEATKAAEAIKNPQVEDQPAEDQPVKFNQEEFFNKHFPKKYKHDEVKNFLQTPPLNPLPSETKKEKELDHVIVSFGGFEIKIKPVYK